LLEPGEIADSYFLAACSALSERHDRVKSLFAPMDNFSSLGYLTSNMFVRGVPKTYLLDDLIMMKSYWNEFIDFPFAPLLPDGAAWMIFAEKAFARLNGYYYRLEGGKFGESIRTLTGAPTKEFKSIDYNQGLLFQILLTSV